ncbi:TetR family transcriptional regulator [Nocardia macrotermitis]|uniref:TetR family transcriptional regulator n=1 Tax=Nocardia macrotermitis TaxID=2585198 RepID=A0A7K0CYJ7_9NOCA|nr:TetR family transcriptional regulator [Nocardia macrotermitis]MQY18543.1 hypothetical protein [Nocardia macrotermitis]
MREYILDIARELRSTRSDSTIDEIAATAGLDSSHIHDYFRGMNDVRDALSAGIPVAAGAVAL